MWKLWTTVNNDESSSHHKKLIINFITMKEVVNNCLSLNIFFFSWKTHARSFLFKKKTHTENHIFRFNEEISVTSRHSFFSSFYISYPYYLYCVTRIIIVTLKLTHKFITIPTLCHLSNFYAFIIIYYVILSLS